MTKTMQQEEAAMREVAMQQLGIWKALLQSAGWMALCAAMDASGKKALADALAADDTVAEAKALGKYAGIQYILELPHAEVAAIEHYLNPPKDEP